MKKTHFGQIVPIEDIELIMSNFEHVVRLPCVCRIATTGRQRRVCYAIGMDLSHIIGDVPELKDFDRVSSAEAVSDMRELDMLGMTHSVWTFQTPFIGGICNCDRDCVAWRFEQRMALGRLMWKSEYAATIEHERCSGCGRCMARCYFDAISCGKGLARVNHKLCYGCGICRGVCESDAITLALRQSVAGARNHW
jgi:ferredoxin